MTASAKASDSISQPLSERSSLKVIKASTRSQARSSARSYYKKPHLIINRDGLNNDLKEFEELAFLAKIENTLITVIVLDKGESITDDVLLHIEETVRDAYKDQFKTLKTDRFRRVDFEHGTVRHFLSAVVQPLGMVKSAILFGLAVAAALGISLKLNLDSSSAPPSPLNIVQHIPGVSPHDPSHSIPPPPPATPEAPGLSLEDKLQAYVQTRLATDIAQQSLKNVRLEMTSNPSYSHNDGIGNCIIDGSIQATGQTLVYSDSFSGTSAAGTTDESLVEGACEDAVDKMIARYHNQN